MADLELDKLCSNTIRLLAADGVQKANSGHPGLPLGAADYAYVLWARFLMHNPEAPKWLNRDRFVLSAGHGSMLLYSLLHLSGYSLSLDELKSFRQWGSKTPGHPEYGHTEGVETTTGPLGQGFTNAVGMAIAEKMMEARLNKFGKEIINHKIYVIAGDGCMMEGITSEAASFAGHLGLNNLVVFYDDNNITIEGRTNITFTEDVAKRYKAYNWNVLTMDGNNLEEIDKTIKKAQKAQTQPTLIISKTIIGYGAPNKNNTHDVHGSPLGAEEIKLMKENMKCDPTQFFCIPDAVREIFAKRLKQLKKTYKYWQKSFDEFYLENADFKKAFDALFNASVPENIKEELFNLFPVEKPVATRVAGGKIMNYIADRYEPLVGGSADLSPSTKTYLDKYASIQKGDFSGRNLNFGIREHAMAGIMNGISLYGGFVSYGSTFHVFTDYCRPSIRLAALMGIQSVFIMTHDSIFVGEDGPTHQPVEQTMACRLIPNLLVFRPADAIETADAWVQILKEKKRPSMILLSRQNLPVINRQKYQPPQISKGAYILKQENNIEKLDAIVIATGSEVSISIEAAESLERQGYSIRVVSMPCVELYDEQSEEYKERVLPALCKNRLVVECGVSTGWERFAGDKNNIIGLDRFGASAPAEILASKFGFTSANIENKIKKLLTK